MQEARDRPKFPRWLLALVGVVAIAIVAAGIWLMIDQRRDARLDVEDDLLQICQLKVDQISAWRQESLANAASLGESPVFGLAVSEWLSRHDPAQGELVLATLASRATLHGYVEARLVDAGGKTLLSTNPSPSELSAEALASIRAAAQAAGPVLTDLHIDPGRNSIHLSAIAPVTTLDTGPQKPPVCVVLIANADDFLYPLIRSWPVPSNTAETLLVRRDGNETLFLNELRHMSGTALRLRLPLNNTDLPATMAVLGTRGIVQGRDYRQVEVIAAVQPVPASGWFVVAKMDAEEALAPVATTTGVLAGFMAALLLGLFGGVMLVWQRGLKRQYLAAYNAEREHHELTERFEHLVKYAADIILLADSDRRIVEVNDLAVTSYGYSREELLTLNLKDLCAIEEDEFFERQRRIVAAQGSSVHETVARRKDGSTFPVEVSDRLFSIDGKTYVQAIVRDNTARKAAEEERLKLERQLQHSQRLESLGVLAGGIAHDFNNILTAVLGHADLVMYDLPLSSPGRQGVQEIIVAARRASELCRQMLAYSGHGQFVIENVDLCVLIGDMVSLLSSAIPKKILLNLHLAKHLPPIRGDVSQINQVIMNLVINAAEAIGERSGVITISTGAQECNTGYLDTTYYRDEELAPGLYIYLEVSDTGIGMDRETLNRLFEPFFTTKFTGRGLGLAAVLGIVRGHKGALRVYSEPGKGTTFKILFPAIDEDANHVPAVGKGLEDGWKGQGTVLLADDEETIRALGRRMLERLGFDVLLAADGREAVDIFERHRDNIILVVLDLTMPHMGGEETFRVLRSLDPEVRVLMSSGYAENEITARFAGKGTAGFVQKPYTLAALAERVRAALGQTST